MEAPAIRFAATRRGKVAYQELGEGTRPLVLVPPLAQHIEMMWEQPVFWRPIQRVASAFRFVQYDKLGTGLSDPARDCATLDDRLEELRAVLDAAAIQRTWLLGFSEGGIITLEAGAHGSVPAPEAYRRFFADVVANWGSAATLTLRDFAPSLRTVPGMPAWMPRYERAAASPAMIGTLMESGFRLDATASLADILQRALVVHLTSDRVIPVAFGRMLAARLPNARLVELAGDDHFSWISPDVDVIIDAIFEFTGARGSGPRVGTVWNPWSAITPSERRIVTLAQRGLTNAEIAGALKLSARTVENHLSRAYAKLGVRSRTELALIRSE